MTRPPFPSERTARYLWYGALTLAGILVVAGACLARQVEPRKVEGNTDWLRHEVRVLSQTLDRLEAFWEEALTEAAITEWECPRSERGKAAGQVVGVRQVSFMNQGRVGHVVVEFPLRGSPPPKPVLEAKDGDVVVSPIDWPASLSGHWLDEAGKPLMYGYRIDEDNAVVLLLNRSEAGEVARAGVLRALNRLPLSVPRGGYRTWTDNRGETLLEDGHHAFRDDPADETMRHLSRFGEWTTRFRHPRKEEVMYDTALLSGVAFLACLVVGAGWWAAREQAHAIRQARDRVSFANAVSHELRTPLTNILLTSDLLEEEVKSEGPRRRVGLIREESTRLSRMVENVLTFARIDRGCVTSSGPRRINLCDFVERCLQTFRPAFRRKNITCEADVPSDGHLYVEEDFLAQIVLNLLSNIEKYAGEGASAHIRVELDDLLRFTVTDDGPGIPRPRHAHVFEPFTRLNDRTDSGVSGAGLGLPISRELARRLGGDLILVPIEKGTKFVLEIPVRRRMNHTPPKTA
ncbi:MAG: HAMP domain-containing sensor histidine kinase [Verrucomicrobiota bacterium]